MTIEIVLLALVGNVRPATLAAVYALVSHPSPRRLLIAYIAGGLLFTTGFGLVVVLVLHGVGVGSGKDEAKGIVEIAGGVVALVFGALLLTGRIRRPRADDAPDAPSRWRAILNHRLTLPTAMLAGPATHVPGLFCLVALHVIVVHHAEVPGALAEVLVYNIVWFVLPIATLAVCVVNPSAARRTVDAPRGWVLCHTRGLLTGVSLAAGAALVVRGVLAL